jgi:TolB-like protein
MALAHPSLQRAVALLLLGACAPAVSAPEVGPVDVSALEAEQARRANDPDGLTRIGLAWYHGGEFRRARDVLAAATALDPRAFEATVYLGLAHEKLGSWDEAIDAYRAAQAMRISRSERAHVEQRLVAITRERLAQEARRAVAMEGRLSATPPEPNTIAVLRFAYLGTDPELRPLETGLTHLIVSDLAKVSRLRLLERERVQALDAELALSAAGRVEPSTAARSGRLLRAASVVQGAIRESGSGLRLNAAVINTTDTAISAESSASDRLQELIVMEKAVVLDLLARMGLSLTPAERRAIEERPTRSLQAFLSWSRGLEAEERGDAAAARREYEEAGAADPTFRAARERAEAARRTAGSTPMTAERLAAVVSNSARQRTRFPRDGLAAGMRARQLRAAIQTVAPTLAGSLRLGITRPPQFRSRLAEALRQDDPVRIGTIDDVTGIIPRP